MLYINNVCRQVKTHYKAKYSIVYFWFSYESFYAFIKYYEQTSFTKDVN